jgi:sugar/nucleoside kinase (ribokinase family)
MSIDLAVASPAFMDMTFVGLEALPALGEERYAGDILRSPGGGAITAIGAARLGLRTALAAPLGQDLDGEFVRRALVREGIELASSPTARTPTTVVMPWAEDRAMVTYDPGEGAAVGDIAALSPRAVVAGLDQLDVVPAGAIKYATCGDADARTFAGRRPERLDGARVLFVNRREALSLTGAATADEAAARLAEGVDILVLTLGADGAIGRVDGTTFAAPGAAVGSITDTTGAGDLLCAAFVWADLAGADPETALHWAVLYSALSVEVPTGAAGAVTRERLVEEATSRGLPPLGALAATGEE